MLFSTPAFFIFFACYYCLHRWLPTRLRLPLILAGSTFFYAYWDVRYLAFPYALLALAIVGTWWLSRAADTGARRFRLGVVIAALLAPLIFFKYANFLYNDVFGFLCPADGKLHNIGLPLGISFVTFTLIGYAVDIYQYKVPWEKRVPLLASAVMFFPHLIAGPIVLPRQLIGQMERPRSASQVNYSSALLIFSVGLVKKLVFADQIATVVNPVFNEAVSWNSLDYLLAMVGFSMQIYCDFSGYSDMAIGLAMLLGVRLPRNFDRPYVSRSVVEFWQRWHITLSSWLRDYLYIPLGGNRSGLAYQLRNVMVTMALGGLWHGARWTFVFWGLAHGVFIALCHVFRRQGGQRLTQLVPDWAKVAGMFGFITFTWVLFRAQSLADCYRVLEGPFTAPWPDIAAFATTRQFPLLLLVIFALTHRFDNITRIRVLARRTPQELLWPVIAFLWALAITISAGSSAEFIYFDF
jgi:alginate O-acetyltransferase complex protein AlgI